MSENWLDAAAERARRENLAQAIAALYPERVIRTATPAMRAAGEALVAWECQQIADDLKHNESI